MAGILPFFLTHPCYACRTTLSPYCGGQYGRWRCSGVGSLVDDPVPQGRVAVGLTGNLVQKPG
jgi:hypothetical protein